MFSSTARYSRASSVRPRGTGPSAIGSTWTHRARAGAGDARADGGPLQAAHDHGRRAAGQLAALNDLSDDPDRGVPPLDAGHEDQTAAGVPAASVATWASSVSSAIVKTIPGSTTPEVSGSRGRV